MIWLVVLGLLLVFGGMGFLRGGVQMGFGFVGLLVGLFLAVPLGPFLEPFVVWCGVENLILLGVLPAVCVFVLVGLVFLTVGIVAHVKVGRFFRLKRDEADWVLWRGLNRGLGLGLGLLVGVVYVLLLGVGVYSVGYLSYQVRSSGDPGWLRFVTGLREGLEGSGLGGLVRGLDPVPGGFYEVADLLGLAHRNPLLEVRFRNYPGFLGLGERGDVQEVAGDVGFRRLLLERSSLADIMGHELGRRLMCNGDLAGVVLGDTDLGDLRVFLEEGRSPLFEDEPLLGRWELNGNAVVNYAKRNTPGVKPSGLRAFKEVVDGFWDGMSLVVRPDGSFVMRGPERVVEVVEEEEEEDGFEDPYGRYYGQGSGYGQQGYGQGRGQQQQQQGAAAKEDEGPRFGGSGRWARTASGAGYYEFVFGSGASSGLRSDANFYRVKLEDGSFEVNRNRLEVEGRDGMNLIFFRVY